MRKSWKADLTKYTLRQVLIWPTTCLLFFLLSFFLRRGAFWSIFMSWGRLIWSYRVEIKSRSKFEGVMRSESQLLTQCCHEDTVSNAEIGVFQKRVGNPTISFFRDMKTIYNGWNWSYNFFFILKCPLKVFTMFFFLLLFQIQYDDRTVWPNQSSAGSRLTSRKCTLNAERTLPQKFRSSHVSS